MRGSVGDGKTTYTVKHTPVRASSDFGKPMKTYTLQIRSEDREEQKKKNLIFLYKSI